MEQATGLPRWPGTSHLVSEMPQTNSVEEPLNQEALQMAAPYIVEEPISVTANQSPEYSSSQQMLSQTFPPQQFAGSFSQGQPSANYLLAGQAYAEFRPRG